MQNKQENEFADLGAVPIDEDYSDLGATPYQESSPYNNVLQFISGTGDALQNMMAGGVNDIASLLSGKNAQSALKAAGPLSGPLQSLSQVNLPMAQTGQGAAYEAGRPVGEVLGTLGSLVTPVGEGIGVAKKASNLLRPGKQAKNIIEELSGGKSLEENNKDLLQGIRNSFKDQKNITKEDYDPIFEEIGDQPIYSKADPYTGTFKQKEFPLNKDVLKENLSINDKKLAEKHEDFLSNPTFKSAHELRSELGKSLGKQRSKDQLLSFDDKNFINTLRDSLSNDMESFVDKNHPDLSGQYKQATNNYKENVVPYLENRSINKLVSGKTKDVNLGTLSNIFKNPLGKPNIQKVVSHLPEEYKNKIVFSEIGKSSNLKGKSLYDALNKLDTKGLSAYKTPKLNNLHSSLSKSLAANNLLKLLGGLGVGGGSLGVAAHLIPHGKGIINNTYQVLSGEE